MSFTSWFHSRLLNVVFFLRIKQAVRILGIFVIAVANWKDMIEGTFEKVIN